MENFTALKKIGLAGVVIALSACQITTNSASTRDDFIQERGLSSYKSVSFHDKGGNSISFDQFRALTENSQSYSMMKNPDASEAIFQIEGNTNKAPVSISEEPKLSIALGITAPKIGKSDLSGIPVIYSDKPTLVSFFFTECAPCIKEIPKINGLAESNPNVQFVSVTFDETSLVKEFVSKYELKTRVVADDRDFIDAMGVRTYPIYALISKDGHLLGTQSGATLQIPMGEMIFEKWIKSKVGT